MKKEERITKKERVKNRREKKGEWKRKEGMLTEEWKGKKGGKEGGKGKNKKI